VAERRLQRLAANLADGQPAETGGSVVMRPKEEAGMAFVQIIEFRTSKIDEMRKIGDEWEAAAGTDRQARRRVLCADRDNPGRYFNVVFFDSYDSAMENSKLPVTQQFSQKMMALGDGQPVFHNLDVIDDHS
jgi:hypothetical protein